MSEEIKGVLNLEDESSDFVKAVKSLSGVSLGVKLSVGWELDRVTLSLADKYDSAIGNLVFQCDQFRSLMENIVNPKSSEKKDFSEGERKQVDKEIQADVEEMRKNPVEKEIAKYHK